MGADVLLEVVDHLFLMVKVLDGEKDGHGEGEKTDQPKDDLKAKAFIKLGQFDKAIEEFRKAAQSDPKHVNSRYNIGLVLLHDKQDIKSAIKAWEEYLRVDSKSERAERIKAQMEKLKKMVK
jgi:tetratricopeptide (TPR) repeat protein